MKPEVVKFFAGWNLEISKIVERNPQFPMANIISACVKFYDDIHSTNDVDNPNKQYVVLRDGSIVRRNEIVRAVLKMARDVHTEAYIKDMELIAVAKAKIGSEIKKNAVVVAERDRERAAKMAAAEHFDALSEMMDDADRLNDRRSKTINKLLREVVRFKKAVCDYEIKIKSLRMASKSRERQIAFWSVLVLAASVANLVFIMWSV